MTSANAHSPFLRTPLPWSHWACSLALAGLIACGGSKPAAHSSRSTPQCEGDAIRGQAEGLPTAAKPAERTPAGGSIEGPVACGSEGHLLWVRGQGDSQIGDSGCTSFSSETACASVNGRAFSEHVLKILSERGVSSVDVGVTSCSPDGGSTYYVGVSNWGHAQLAARMLSNQLVSAGIGDTMGIAVHGALCEKI